MLILLLLILYLLGLLTRHLELHGKIVTSKQLTPNKKRPKLLQSKESLQHHSHEEKHFKVESDNKDVLLQNVEFGVQAVRDVISCSSCGAKVQPHQLGKHLISHYHYHR